MKAPVIWTYDTRDAAMRVLARRSDRAGIHTLWERMDATRALNRGNKTWEVWGKVFYA